MMSCKTLDNQLFYDPELFPKLLRLQDHYEMIAQELQGLVVVASVLALYSSPSTIIISGERMPNDAVHAQKESRRRGSLFSLNSLSSV